MLSLNSKIPDDFAFSCSMPSGISVCCDVKYSFMVPPFGKWYYSGVL